MNISDFDYDLPKELIAQLPLKQRDASRLLVVDRVSRQLSDKHFADILEYFSPGDVLVLNDTKVFPARIIGKKKKTQGKVDLLLLTPYEKAASAHRDDYTSLGEIEEMRKKQIWRCLVQPVLKEGQEMLLGPDGIEAVFIKRDSDGTPLVEFKTKDDICAIAHRIGTMPLPPYIKREADKSDEAAYQTVYAKKEGAVAAPTAGFHFTEDLLKSIRAKGVEILYVTLHVGYGTFKPVEDLENHKMHSELFELKPEVADKINKARSEKGKIWAAGTTTLRVLETCVQNGKLIAGEGQTDLFIKEPFTFEAVDRLITNFHLPRTTLLLLISAFMGEELRRKAYQHAIGQRYRFYSYGDAMVIV